MTKKQMEDEKLYQSTMLAVRVMREKGLISESEYEEIDTIFLEKYKPLFGVLFSKIDLQ